MMRDLLHMGGPKESSCVLREWLMKWRGTDQEPQALNSSPPPLIPRKHIPELLPVLIPGTPHSSQVKSW